MIERTKAAAWWVIEPYHDMMTRHPMYFVGVAVGVAIGLGIGAVAWL